MVMLQIGGSGGVPAEDRLGVRGTQLVKTRSMSDGDYLPAGWQQQTLRALHGFQRFNAGLRAAGRSRQRALLVGGSR
jgi:hypothetical protein